MEQTAAQMTQLGRAAAKASERRFTGEPITGFGDLEPAQQVATLIRDMRDPTKDQLQTMLGALATRVDDMDKSGRYFGADVLGERIDAAFDAVDLVFANTDREGT